MDREEFIQTGAEYAAGALDAEDTRRFEEYLATASQEELGLLGEFMSVSSLLPLPMERQNPPPSVREELLQRVAVSVRARASVERRTEELVSRPAPSPRKKQVSWLPFGVTFGALVMVLAFSMFVSNLMGTIDDQRNSLARIQTENRELQTQLVALRDEVTRKEELLKVLAARHIEVTIMGGAAVNPVGYGKVIWDPDHKTAILQVANLPAVPGDKDYQLWVVKGEQKISAGVFAVTGDQPGFFKIENLAVSNPSDVGAFAVTLEPRGGVPQPTGAMYLVGAVKPS